MGKRTGHKRITRLGIPNNERERAFCKAWLKHYDHKRAYVEAGYSNDSNSPVRALKMLERFTEHLRPLREAKAREVAKLLVVEDQDILKGMSAKAVFDPGDFVQRAPTPKTVTVLDPKTGKEREQPLEWYGEPVFASRLKPFEQLTPQQRAVVEIVGDSSGEVTYRLPNIREQHMYLTSTGRQFGMFLEKLITERHFHKHNHAHLELTNVPTQQLQVLTTQLLPFVGAEFANQLGFTQEDIEDARAATDLVAANGKR
jgi:hypothetical protein